MENVVNAIAKGAKATEIADEISNALMAKAAEKIEALRPQVAVSMFSQSVESEEDNEETTGEEGEL
tara:strand:+ start:229 stop:426 length:198 start_codon:yes stop_codon:yes gene_type:complete